MTTRSPSPRLSSLGPAVAGYRLDELIGIGVSANVYAGVLDVGGGVPEAGASDPVAVKLCLTSGDAARGDPPGGGRPDRGFGREAECRALALRPISAMPRLVDLATTERGELLLVMTLCRGRPVLSSTPGARSETVDAGELSRLVRELHEAGVAHGGLDPGAVLVHDDGSHALVGFRSARLAGDAGFAAAVGADLRAVAALARGRPVSVAFSGQSPVGAVRVPRGAVEPRIGALEPRAGGVEPQVGGAGSRVDGVEPRVAGADSRADAPDASSAADALIDAWQWTDDAAEEPGRELAFLETLEPAVLAIRESGVALRGLVRSRSAGAMAPRRRRILAAGGALVVGAVVAGCLLLPSGGSNAAVSGDAAATSTSADSAAAAAAAASSPGATTSDAGAGAGDGDGDADGDEPARAAVLADDPLGAVSGLLELRRACLRTGEPKCLDAVDQWNAPALLADQDLMRVSAPPDDPLASVTGIALVERVGATALLRGTTADSDAPETTKPVSLLVMRGETGWRLRSYRVGQGPG
ncbi:hypothetical protein ACEXQE_18210 [Herbiconiux sp. P17]|uniref:hypothetical protein n=1 Tax=Herbiconiux wuyangfengii TaxID=3342794 RepID=UPI0035B90AD0